MNIKTILIYLAVISTTISGVGCTAGDKPSTGIADYQVVCLSGI